MIGSERVDFSAVLDLATSIAALTTGLPRMVRRVCDRW